MTSGIPSPGPTEIEPDQVLAARARHGPLRGCRVLELGAIVAGRFCGRLLADFGAEVVKVKPAEMTAGFDTVTCMPEQLGAFSRAELTKWAQVAKEAGVRVK